MKRQGGAVMVEAVLILPFALFFFFGTFELAHIVKVNQVLSLVSHAGASSGFRTCTSITQLGSQTNCLTTRVTPDLLRYMVENGMGNDTEIILRSYVYDPATRTVDLVSEVRVPNNTNYQSRFPNGSTPYTSFIQHRTATGRLFLSAMGFTAGGVDPVKQQLVTSEVFHRYTPKFFRILGNGAVYYEGTQL